MRVTIEHVLPHPVERVFAVVADPSRRPEWQENTSNVRLVTDGPVAVGTRWTEHQRGVGDVEGEVTGLERDHVWAEAGEAHSGSARVTVTFTPDGDGTTHLHLDVELRLRGLKKAFEHALAPMVRHQMPKDLDRLAALLDREAG